MRVHLVDGTFELYRAHFSHRPQKSVPQADGPMDVKATAGLVASMLGLLHDPDEAVTHLAIAFDNPIRSFRNDLYDAYKSDEGVPPSLRRQFDLAEVAMKALGIVVWSMDEWEADDALGTAATRYAGEAEQVRILTPDKDLGQCVQGTRVVQVDRMRRKLIDEDVVRAVRGVAPSSIPDLLGLVGDASDGFPGLPGFGAKSAAAVLARWGTIERIPDDAAAWDVKVTGAPRLAATLAGHRDEAMLYKKLATLVTDVPLPETLADLEFRGVPRSSFATLCDQLASQDLRTRPVRWRS
ncbi:MAG TPA: 5'-3' exonuclease H3TH domain-containing protein [Labilithrix sp.]|nr:5'-3' exonuclease H3TH domain-containing protein [Labilithrix sp.]